MSTPLNWRFLLGEFVVIVVGVLLALSADQWRESRADAKLEAAYLAALLDDIDAARARLITPLENTGKYLAAAEQLSNLSPGDQDIEADVMTRLVGDALFNLTGWDYRLPALEDLKNTGRVGLISNQEIRRALAEVDGFASRVDGTQDDLEQTQHQTIDPFLIRHTDLPAMIPLAASRAAEHMGPALGIDLRPLLPNPELQNIVALRIVTLLNVKAAYEAMDDHLEQLAGLIGESTE